MNPTATANRPASQRWVLIIAGLALAGGGIFYLACARGTAAHAVAPPEAIAAQYAIDQFLNTVGSDVQTMRTTLSSTQALVERLTAYPNATQVPLGKLKANPFGGRVAGVASINDTSAQQDSGDAERVAMLKRVEGLQLQSIVSSDNHKACMINNVLYREGQPIGTFTIDKINDSAVVIRSGDYRFELKIQG